MSTTGQSNDSDPGMSPFAHLLHNLQMRHNIRQSELAERLGYEQSYISALEIGLKGPPGPDFVDRLIAALELVGDPGQVTPLRISRHLRATAPA